MDDRNRSASREEQDAEHRGATRERGRVVAFLLARAKDRASYGHGIQATTLTAAAKAIEDEEHLTDA